MPQSINSTLRARVDAFVEDLSEIIREAALEAVQEALGGTAAPKRRGPGRPRKKAPQRKTARRKTTTRKKAGRKKAAKKAARKKTGKRIRRTTGDLKTTAAKIHAHVKANPGTSMSAMTKAIGKPAKDLRGPLKLLLADKKLRTEGQKRGTTYWAGGAKKAAKRKTSKKRAAKPGTRASKAA